MKYFLKVLPQNPVYFSSGERVPVETLGGGYGVIAIEDDKAADLEALAKKKLGGVEVIDQARYEELKKKFPHSPVPPKRKLRIFDPSGISPLAPPAEAPAAVAPPAVAAPSAPPAPVPAEPAKPFSPRRGKPKVTVSPPAS